MADIRPQLNYAQIQRTDGTWWAVGTNGNAMLVDGTTTERWYPVPMIWADSTQITTG